MGQFSHGTPSRYVTTLKYGKSRKRLNPKRQRGRPVVGLRRYDVLLRPERDGARPFRIVILFVTTLLIVIALAMGVGR